ncbi:ATP-dependent DNA helicase DDX11 isoform X1 [Jatropha curcas]|uniref:ATP-dependent DNA helicase DDX11 isoform X1 n=1 Tax=Jatropha curcas TaxID=180498 RepID=UPI0005FB8F4F|nr:ATP-dependent DNA helicase DDX11 isoform X1 [Jatropha curcas]
MENEENEPKFPGFPYKPYSIQMDFMKALYRSLDKGGVSMLESPTGTGKTLSIICSSLQWVYDKRQKEKSKAKVESDQSKGDGRQIMSDDEPDWMRNFVVKKEDIKKEKKVKKKFGLGKQNERKIREGYREIFPRVKEEEDCHMKKGHTSLGQKNDGVEFNDEEFLLEEYESEDEGSLVSGKSKRKAGRCSVISSSDEEGEKYGSDGEEEEKELKIYFCSRTHSQLSQFVKELRKTSFDNEITAVCLGSRKNFCINEDVLKLGNATRINERCLELQKYGKSEVSKIKNLGLERRVPRTKASSRCPMLRKHKQRQFRDEISQQGALDIEDLVQLGRSMGTCPYYGSRSMVPAADLVVLPYQSLLSKSSRELLGLNLKNNIVIIDEAHNLADSLISMHDAKITFSELDHVHSHIKKYFARFRNLLGPGNRRYIQTLMVVTRAFLQTLSSEKDWSNANTCQVEEKTAFDTSMAINDFLFSLNIDNINLVKLLHYIKENNFIHKVCGYGEKVASLQKDLVLNNSGECSEELSMLSSFRALVDMLVSLTNNDGDGRIIISKSRPTCSGRQGGFLKYVMLTGEKIFSEIVEEARAIILAGGTLQPIEETRERLFPWLPLNQLHFFSCSHIVPPESILPIAVSRGPSGQSFDFSYSSRSSLNIIEELGLLLCNVVAVVPEGIVVFFSSFEYEAKVYDAWKTSGILERIMKRKCIFREPRRNADVELVLKEYKETIDRSSGSAKEDIAPQSGAVLLAVVGGKISEGINFSDEMGRCIVMVGLPYPSPSDIELIERVKHIESLGESNSARTSKISASDEYFSGDIQAAFSILRSCKRRGQEYYENLCMKAVNQSIGRAIRHINDYAAILLVDMRYASASSKRSFSHPTNKLPQWIKDCLVSATTSYGEVHKLLHQFFKFNKKRGCQ